MAYEIEMGMERRRHARTPREVSILSVRLDPDGGDVVDNLQMVDISRSGMGATADRYFRRGQRIILSLPSDSDNGYRSVYATIVQCHQDGEDYRVGLEFDTTSAGAWGGLGKAVAYAA